MIRQTLFNFVQPATTMRFDKLTTKFQQALADAQSLALGHDTGFIEPQHLLAALLDQEDGGTASLLAARGRQRAARCRQALAKAIERLPKVEGTRRRDQRSRATSTTCSTSPTRKRRSAATSSSRSELFLLALADDKGETGRLLQGARRSPARRSKRRSRRCAAAQASTRRKPKASARRSKKYTIDLTERARAGQARPGHRPRRRDPPHDPDPAAAHQEQSGADRRAGRGQDRDRRRPRAAHRQRRGARDAEGQARAVARHGGAARRRQVPRRVRGAAEGRAEGHRARTRARPSSSSTSCTRWSAPARPKARSTPATC